MVNTPEAQARSEKFQAFLKSADQVAADMLHEHGISPYSEYGDRDVYYCGLEGLAQEFLDPYKTTDLDDMATMSQMTTMIDAAHMVGIALGVRMMSGGVR